MKILVAGDFCPIQRVAHYFKEADYGFVLEEVREKVEQSDYAIVNFECPVCKGGERPIVKRGPHLKLPTITFLIMEKAQRFIH